MDPGDRGAPSLDRRRRYRPRPGRRRSRCGRSRPARWPGIRSRSPRPARGPRPVPPRWRRRRPGRRAARRTRHRRAPGAGRRRSHRARPDRTRRRGVSAETACASFHKLRPRITSSWRTHPETFPPPECPSVMRASRARAGRRSRSPWSPRRSGRRRRACRTRAAGASSPWPRRRRASRPISALVSPRATSARTSASRAESCSVRVAGLAAHAAEQRPATVGASTVSPRAAARTPVGQHRPRRVLQQVAGRARPRPRAGCRCSVSYVGRTHAPWSGQAPGGLHPVAARHTQVHQDHVRPQPLGERHRLGTGCCPRRPPRCLARRPACRAGPRGRPGGRRPSRTRMAVTPAPSR